MKKTITTLIMTAICISFTYSQSTLLVPSEYSTIQEAINSSAEGDTIIVSPGTYLENINFNGKDVFLTSEFLRTKRKSTIESTIIDGSQPMSQDTGSVVRIVSGESQDCVLTGFTITGGTGTKTYNVNEGLYFRTGGGVTIDQSSPTIMYNIITNNQSLATAGVTGAGGGGIRVGNGKPIIQNNIISHNKGGYAGGIMIAFCEGMRFNNNIVAYNHCEGDFGGGGGIYIDWENVTIENNTIAYNHSDSSGSALCVTGNQSEIINCIIHGNTGSTSQPIIRKRFSGNPKVSYSNIQDGYEGDDILDLDPDFLDTLDFVLKSESPCIDKGNPDEQYHDKTDPLDDNQALFPSHGTNRNDLGAYGGIDRMEFLDFVSATPNIISNKNLLLWAYAGALFLEVEMAEVYQIKSIDLQGRLLQNISNHKLEKGLHSFSLTTTGVQIIQIGSAQDDITSQLIINLE